MKKFAALLLVLTLGLFSIGCGGTDPAVDSTMDDSTMDDSTMTDDTTTTDTP